MALLLDPFTPSAAAAAEQQALGQAPNAPGVELARLIERCHLDPADFQLRKLQLQDQACFAQGHLVVTVSNGRARASRTYVSRAYADEWLLDFEQDLRAGVFSPAP